MEGKQFPLHIPFRHSFALRLSNRGWLALSEYRPTRLFGLSGVGNPRPAAFQPCLFAFGLVPKTFNSNKIFFGCASGLRPEYRVHRHFAHAARQVERDRNHALPCVRAGYRMPHFQQRSADHFGHAVLPDYLRPLYAVPV